MDDNLDLSKNTEMEQALKEFEVKYSNEQKTQVSSTIENLVDSKMVQLVMKYSAGHIKDEKNANYVLLGIVVLAIIASLFLFFGGISRKINTNQQRYLNTNDIPLPPSESNN